MPVYRTSYKMRPDEDSWGQTISNIGWIALIIVVCALYFTMFGAT